MNSICVIDEIRKREGGITYSKFAKIVGVPPQTLYDIRDGKIQSITHKFADKIISAYPIYNKSWLLTGVGEILNETSSNVIDKPQKNLTSGVPYFNVDFIGGFDLVINDQTINPEYRIDFKRYNDAEYWVNITGHSMEPLISNGDIIAIKEIHGWRDFLPFGDIYGIITNELRTVKKVTKSDRGNDYLKLIPINEAPEYQPQDIPIKLITHVFKVLGCAKKL